MIGKVIELARLKARYDTTIIHFVLSTHVDYAESRILDIGRDGEVDKVVDRVAVPSESVDGLLPGERARVPLIAL